MISFSKFIFPRRFATQASFKSPLQIFKFTPDKNIGDFERAFNSGCWYIDAGTTHYNGSDIQKALTRLPPNVQRHNYFIVTSMKMMDFRDTYIRAFLGDQLKKLRLSHIDRVILECPEYCKMEYGNEMTEDLKLMIQQSWSAMEKCYHEGKVRSLGVRNFDAQMLEHLLAKCKVKPSLVEVKPDEKVNESRLVRLCKSKGIESIKVVDLKDWSAGHFC